ncbi:MAG: nitroreductase family protein [Nocardioides sp.]
MLPAPTPAAEVLAEPLRSRWSPTVFDVAHTLTTDEIETLLRAAQWAPSAGNSQPWRFLVLERGSAGHQAFVPHLSRGNAGWVPRASLVVVGATQVAEAPDGSNVNSADFARYDVGQAAAHVTLQARAMGLHAHQFAGFDHPGVAEAFGVPDHFQLMAGIAVGMRGDATQVDERDREREQRPRTRRPLIETAFADRWAEPWAGLAG